MSRYEVKAKEVAGFGALYFYVHDSEDWSPTTMARGTKTYKTEGEAAGVAAALNAKTVALTSGRNGLTNY